MLKQFTKLHFITVVLQLIVTIAIVFLLTSSIIISIVFTLVAIIQFILLDMGYQSKIIPKKNYNLLLKAQEITQTGSWEINLNTNTCIWSKLTYDIHKEPYNKKITLEDSLNYYIEAHRPIITQCVQDAIKHGKPWDKKLQIKDKEKNVKWVRVVGFCDHDKKGNKILNGIFRNIQEEEKAIQGLTALNITLNLTLQAAKIGLWEWDLTTNELTWSTEMFKIYDIPPSNTLNFLDWYNLIEYEDRAKIEKLLNDSVTNNVLFKTSFKIKHNNKIKYIKSIGQCLYDLNGNPLKFVGINLDVTDEELYAKNLININEELNNFTALVSHDLRQPVTIFLGYLDILTSEKFTYTDDQNECLKELLKASKQMEAITNDLIDILYAGKKNIGSEQSNLNKILNKTINHQKYDENKIQINYPSDFPLVKINSRDCRSLFNNFISNSIKFSDKDRFNTINIAYEKHSNYITIVISDTGIGIKEKDLIEISKPFYRVYSHQEYPGTGIGLTICNKILKKYGSDLNIKSTYGQGTIIYFNLPI